MAGEKEGHSRLKLKTVRHASHQVKNYGKLEKLTEPGQEIQIDFTGKLHKNIHGEVQILIAMDRFSKWRNVKIC